MEIDYYTYEFRCCNNWYDWGETCKCCGESFGYKEE